MAIEFKITRGTASAVLLSLGALSLSACSTVNSKSKMSSQSVFGNSVSSYAIAPLAYGCGTSMSCKVLSPSDCPITKARQSYASVNEIQCYDGTIVSDVSQCGPISLPVQSSPIPVPAQYVQAATSLCSSGVMSDTIYYDYNIDSSAETSNAARRILDYGQQCSISSVQVFGHTDTSGGEMYNKGLSRRRAQDVKRELVRQGLTNVPITAQPMGETQPAVDRGDGVREPMNRRSEIHVQSGRRGY